MTVRFVPLDAMGEFPSGRLERIVGWLDEAASDIVPLLALDRVDVVVAPTPKRWCIPGWSLNAYAHGIGRLSIGIDPDFQDEAGLALSDQLRTTLAHELHHIKRFRSPGPHTSLGAQLVMEGLAQCFQEEVGCPTPNYALAVQGELLGLAALRARKDWDAVDYNHNRWFFGDRADPTWPWSGGYSLGYAVARFFLDVTKRTASDAAGVSTADVRRHAQPRLDELAAIASRAGS